MVYDGNRSRVWSAFPTRIGTEDNCDIVTGSARAVTGCSRYRDGDTGRAVSESGRGEIIIGNGETCNSLSSKSVPGSSDETAANPGAAARSRTEPLDPGASSAGEQPDWTMQPGEAQMDVGGLSA